MYRLFPTELAEKLEMICGMTSFVRAHAEVQYWTDHRMVANSATTHSAYAIEVSQISDRDGLDRSVSQIRLKTKADRSHLREFASADGTRVTRSPKGDHIRHRG